MLKKFLVALIVAVLMLTSQIAAAEIPIDWSRVKRISSKTEFADYMKSQQRAGESIVPVILTNGLNIPIGEFLTLCPSSVVSQRTVFNDGQTSRVIYTLMDYPSTKVINAYRSGDTIWLNAEEMELYNKAVEIINVAKTRNGIWNQEVYIYEEIARRVTYHTEKNAGSQPHFFTAYGALVKGKANCQGYTDAFYLLGNLMGWNVGKMSGGNHQWNTIEFGGKVYCVDVTWGDSVFASKNKRIKFNSYMYFNAPIEIMEVTHQWDRALQPANLQPSVDGRYAYCLFNRCLRVSSAEAGLNLLAQKIGKENFNWLSVMVPFNEKYSVEHNQENANYVASKAGKNLYLNTWRFGKYLFFTANTL